MIKFMFYAIVTMIATNVSLGLVTYFKTKLSSSLKKLFKLYEHKNIFVHRNIGVFILGVSCLNVWGYLSRGRVV